MAAQQPELDHTFVNLTDDPAEGRGARRTYIRRAVMKNFHKRRNQKKRASRNEGEATSSSIPENGPLEPVTLIDWQSGPPSRALIPNFLLFEQRKLSGLPMMQISNFILRFLCGQASKVAHDSSLVGFVHPSSEHELEVNLEGAAMKPSPLKTCQNLLRAYGSYKSDTLSWSVDKEPLWEMIHQHQEWIYSKAREPASCSIELLIPTFNPWELLSAAQCLAIYVLLRVKLGKNNRSFPNGDIALLYTLGALFRRLQFERLLDITHHPSDDWRQWVFCESFIRIATIYFTLNVIVSMEFGLPCNSPQDWNIDDMPLPASKASWGAQNTTDWTKFTKVLPPYKQLKWRDLLSPAASNDCPVEEWKESSDELGMVVTMAMTVRAQQLRDRSQSSSSSRML
ncbi:uncharacterized protein TRIVIDRAFT_44263 [Trichoderma virens Gv29-8]|uniref:Transcription factor domain-containing protein n=1 Tax=Hypocrea virens (strain Gv29-8 / FGSC 10586) TaxID=413071 RepID=G9N3M3_HYPVG|nr:uncharacterized protein TRIVIDRAFT_44263 [Trichoderma virens Gv29-8]EHK18907.1 hypothetical protein TRIVIDRAFT_44263 [Trichoderma virens Gv29-8]UKZ56683.1 hypothetical protein TrVGV298_010523 [Trichoderma virens]